MSDDQLLEAALAMTDGEAVDWSAHESSMSDADRRLLLRLRQIETVAHLHGPAADEPPADASIRSGRDTPNAVPLQWGPLEILDKVGRGSYGDVYRARDPRLGRDVALKLLRHRDSPAEAESRLVREGHLLARVKHPNVVTVFGAERIEGRIGVWMEFIEGETLEDELRRRGPLPLEELARIGITLCDALDAVHAAGLLHRDLKAQNIMRETTGRLVLMDFGAGHDTTQDVDREGLAGTPAYLAPEVLSGGPHSVSSDVYALGVVLFRLATGRFPVEGRSLPEVREAHRTRQLPTIASIRADVPQHLAAAIDRALSLDPLRRYGRAVEMRRALEASVAPARPRNRWLLAAAAVAIVATGVALWLVQSGGGRAPAQSPAASTGIQQRIVWPSPDARAVYMGTISRNGRYISSYDYQNRGVIVRDLVSGTTRAIVSADGKSGPEFSALSRDGTQIAYGWHTRGRSFELRVASTRTDGATPRVILRDLDGTIDYILPCDWSVDDSSILAAIRRGDRLRLALVKVADGSLTTLIDGYWHNLPRAVISNDGRYVAASMPRGRSEQKHDIFLLRADGAGGPTQPLIDGPGHDVVAGWSPYGNEILFLSERSGGRSLWGLKILNGSAAGDPVLLRPDSPGTPLGVDASGALFMAVTIANRDIYVASADFATGRLLSPPARPVSRYVGTNTSPSFSPDGKTLAYVSSREGMDGGTYIVLQSVEDGSFREFRLAASILLHLRWSPDGKALIGTGTLQSRVGGLYRVAVATGAVELLLAGAGSLPQLSADNSTLYFVRSSAPRPAARLEQFVQRDLASGRERVLLENTARMTAAISPDGRRIAAVLADEIPNTMRRLVVLEAGGGERRELFQHPELALLARWTPDSRQILISRAGRLAIVPASGGSPVTLDLQITPPPQREEHLAVHPDGKRLVFVAGESRVELWSVEGFLTAPGRQ